MKTLDLKTAASHIKQACDEISGPAWRSPFFFLVGAGISHPSVPLASDIEAHCRDVATKYGRTESPVGSHALDTYSHWFGTAFPQPIQRQRYLRKLIENKPISHANLRLAHLLLLRTISNLVVTPNFDDLLSRALTLFGRQHITCDHPNTVERIDPEIGDVQLVHVHGTYWFYDCCNLYGELAERAKPSLHTNLTMASLLDSILAHRAPIVIGYSGWNGDVFMRALQRRLQTRLPFNLYWFCYRRTSADTLPDWLRSHEDVRIVLPLRSQQDRPPDVDARLADSQTGEQSEVTDTSPASSFSTKEGESQCLPAQQVLDELIQAFALKAPDLTVDPLTFFAQHLKSSLPHGGVGRSEDEIYFIDSVIMKIERASQRESESLQIIESQLEAVRDALRRSQYIEGIERASKIRTIELSEYQVAELSTAVRSATLGLDDDSPQELDGHELQANLLTRLLKFRPGDVRLELQLGNALMGKGSTLARLNRSDEAIREFGTVLHRFALQPDAAFQKLVSAALMWQANVFNNAGRLESALAAYDEIIKKYADSVEIYLLERVARSFLEKGNALYSAGRKNEALDAFEEVLIRFGERADGALPIYVARTLVRKGIVLESLDKDDEALEAYKSVEERFGNLGQTLRNQRREALRRTGQRLLSLNRPADALDSFQRAIQIQPGDIASTAGMGNALRAMGQHERAIEIYHSLLNDDQAQALPFVYIGNSQFDLGQYREAESSLNHAISLRPQDRIPYGELAELQRALGEFEAARETIKRAEGAGVELQYLRFQQALTETEAQNYHEALALVAGSIELGGTLNGFCHNLEGSIYTKLQRLDEAAGAYTKAIENRVKGGHFGLGNVKLIAGQLDEAERCLLTALKLLPAVTGSRFRLAIVYGMTNRPDAADKMLHEIIELFPSSLRPNRVLRRATTLTGLGRVPEAIAEIAALINKIPKLPDTLVDFWNDLEIMSRVKDNSPRVKALRKELFRSIGLCAPSQAV